LRRERFFDLLTPGFQWISANVGGATKRSFAAAIISGSFAIGNIIGPQTFQSRDAPQYRPAKLAVMGTQAGCAVVTITLFGYYAWMNKRRGLSSIEQEEPSTSLDAWKRQTDKENKGFKYVY
jgi:hypothetical protein